MSVGITEIDDFFADESICPAASENIPEPQPALQKLPPSPWRSLGQYLDYSDWKDRERFAQLDMAISVQRIRQDRIDALSKTSQSRRAYRAALAYAGRQISSTDLRG
jgi:hypothetical protein